MSYRQLPSKLLDCVGNVKHGETELYIVEGDSASVAVGIARDKQFQAVLPMQGKPLNAWKANKNVVARNEFLAAVIEAIGAGWGESFELARARYAKILLLFDPDADGIHCGALMLMFFYRWMKPMLVDRKIYLVRPPMFEITATRLPSSVCVMTEEQATAEHLRLQREGYSNVLKRRLRGLASLGGPLLSKHCLSSETRNLVCLNESDAMAAINTFSPKVRVGR